MNSLLDEDTEDDLDDRPVRARDREITLGTTMVLGIFFALAAYGAVLFGFGYSMGVKHLTSTPAASPESTAATFSGFKPPPGSPLAAANSISNHPGGGASVAIPDTATPPVTGTPTAKMVVATPKPAPQANVAPPQSAAVTRPTPAPAQAASAAPAAPQITPNGAFVVQVAAVSHQEDADLLVVTLKRRGYPVVIKHEPQDSLLHVQVGSFATKKDADAMRLRLQADGFNAIVK